LLIEFDNHEREGVALRQYVWLGGVSESVSEPPAPPEEPPPIPGPPMLEGAASIQRPELAVEGGE